jgi:polar amino acid transport system substrate-binding protein
MPIQASHPRRLLLRHALALALCAALPAARAQCDKVLSVAASDYAPYLYVDRQGQWIGLDADMMAAIFKEAGCAFRYAALVAPKRMISMVNSGKTDVMLGATETPERARLNYFGPAYRNETVALMGLAGKVAAWRDVKSLEELQARRVRLLIPNAGWYGAQYERAKPQLRAAGLAYEFTYFGQGVRMLVAGRGDLMVSDGAAMLMAARKQKVAAELLPYVILTTPVHLMFSKASVSAHDVQVLNEATVRLEKQGVLRKIRARYGLP